MEADRISKEAPAGARVKSWEMTTSGSKIPAWRMGRAIIDVGKPDIGRRDSRRGATLQMKAK